MIQRIQSVYLLMAAASFGSMFVLPLSLNNALRTVDILFISALIVFMVVMIFSYKDRKKQVKLGYLALLFSLVFFSLIAFAGKGLENKATVIGSVLPLLSMLFIFLAIRAIKKDEALVRSADRIR